MAQQAVKLQNPYLNQLNVHRTSSNAVFRTLGDVCRQDSSDPRSGTPSSNARDMSAILSSLYEERDRLREQQRRVMELLRCESPDRLLHDLRNVLNERELYRTLAEIEDGKAE